MQRHMRRNHNQFSMDQDPPEVLSDVQPEYPDPEDQELEDEDEADEVDEEEDEDKKTLDDDDGSVGSNEEDEEKKDLDDDDGSVGSDEDEEYENPWKKLKERALDALEPVYQKQVEPHLEEGVSQEWAAARAVNDLLPAYRKELRSLYLHYLKWYRCLKQDRIHQQVVKTLRKFMDGDYMNYEEAVEAAVNKRKFLLNSLLKKVKVPEEPDE